MCAKRRQEWAALQRLVAVILKAQQVEKQAPYPGGWRYEPRAADSDISLSGWNALALRAAQDVGVPVPKESLARAAGFVARCYLPESKQFGYQPGGPARPGATGTGILCLYLLDANPEDRKKAAEAARAMAQAVAQAAAAAPGRRGAGRIPVLLGLLHDARRLRRRGRGVGAGVEVDAG